MSEKTYKPSLGGSGLRNIQASTPGEDKCISDGERQCEDGSCIARVELCPEEQLMNQNTILIMIIVGLAVVVFLVILYCFQQRQRRANRAFGNTFSTGSGIGDDCDNSSLYAPPPAYEEVVNSNLYPPTPEQRRLRQVSVEEPMTPPPNYDTALVILARSQESVLSKPLRQSLRQSTLVRRSVSLEHMGNNQNNGNSRQSSVPQNNGNNRQSSVPADNANESSNNKSTVKESRLKNFFRFSRQFSRPPSAQPPNGTNANNQTPPPYPLTPPAYPVTPPPPLTPLSSSITQPECVIPDVPVSESEVIS